MDTCTGFCNGPKNTAFGLCSYARDGLRDIHDVFKRRSAEGKFLCPVGYTQNPTTEEKTRNLIAAGGRHSICPRNTWKW